LVAGAVVLEAGDGCAEGSADAVFKDEGAIGGDVQAALFGGVDLLEVAEGVGAGWDGVGAAGA
jgi:hypothetical protein